MKYLHSFIEKCHIESKKVSYIISVILFYMITHVANETMSISAQSAYYSYIIELQYKHLVLSFFWKEILISKIIHMASRIKL